MPHPESLSVAGRLHEATSFEAQRLVDGDDPIHSVYAGIVELVNDYRGHLPNRAKDPYIEIEWKSYFERSVRQFSGGGTPEFHIKAAGTLDPSKMIDTDAERLRCLRIVRATVLAAMSRVMGDMIIQKVLHYSTDDEINMEGMMEGYHPARYYSEGMTDFLDETIDEIITALSDSRHQYHALFELTAQVDHDYLSLVRNDAGRTGAKMKTWNNIYGTLHDLYVINYQDLVTPLAVTHGISIQKHYSELPDSETLTETAAKARPHWLALATMSRAAFQNILFGEELASKVTAYAKRAGTFPTWLSSWPDGMSRAMNGVPNPFAGCPLGSPLLDRAPDEYIEPFKSPGHCSGNIALSASPEANERADELFGLLDGEIEEGRYLPAALLVDLGRTAAKYAYADPLFRRALIMGRQACDTTQLTLPEQYGA